MNKFNIPMFLLAVLVICMFLCVGIAIAYQNLWLAGLFFILGFGFMSTGLTIKRKRSGSH